MKNLQDKYFGQYMIIVDEISEIISHIEKMKAMTRLPEFFERIYQEGYKDGIKDGIKKGKKEAFNFGKQ